MTAQTADSIIRTLTFGLTSEQGDAWTVTVTQWSDGWTVADAHLPKGFWGEGPYVFDDVWSGDTVPTVYDLQEALDARVESQIDEAWDRYLSKHYGG